MSNDYPNLLSLESCSEGNSNWANSRVQETHREDVLYRQAAHSNGPGPLPQGQMSLPPFSTQLSLDGMTMQGSNTETRYQQHQGFGQATGHSKDVLLSPISLLDADVHVGSGPQKRNRAEEITQPRRSRRKSGSRAEQMISDVENLYEFGISLSLFPEDPLLRKSLRRMNERFRGLVRSGVSCDQRDMYDSSSSKTDSDE